MRADRLDLLFLVVVAGLWGSAFIAIRAGLLAGASPFIFAEYRYALATAVVGVFCLATRQERPPLRAWLSSSLLGGCFMMGGYAALLYWGEQYTGGGLASVFVSSVPLWTALVAFRLLPSERLGRWGWSAVGLGFVGVLVIFLPEVLAPGGGSIDGAIGALAAAALAAVGSVLLRRTGVNPSGAWNLTGELGVATLFLLPIALLVPGGLAFPVTAVTIGTTIYLAVGASVLGYGLYFVLLQRAGPQRSNMVTYLNPVVGVSIGFLALGEGVTVLEILGFGLILLSIYLLRSERRPAGPPVAARGTVRPK
ncbi:MAG TPA: DMT family transporter [Thermoplasmata archaeon]|nr:DMT family transporter [Thermoplasmata archaeon]